MDGSAPRSIPFSAMASRTAGLIRSAGYRPGAPDPHAVTCQVPEEAGRHLGPAGVVYANEEDFGSGS